MGKKWTFLAESGTTSVATILAIRCVGNTVYRSGDINYSPTVRLNALPSR